MPKVKTAMYAAVYEGGESADYKVEDGGLWYDEEQCRENNPDAVAIAKVIWEE